MTTTGGLRQYEGRIQRYWSGLNQNNLNRTDYYYRYWHLHPEVPWALMANLVSRNAGYQMTDLSRYEQWIALNPSQLLLHPATRAVITGLSSAHIRCLFVLLEAGNFLIFRDVYPQLQAYAWAKRFPEQADTVFERLLRAPFNTDPFIVEEWRSFFQQARAHNWLDAWLNDPAQRSLVRRMSYSLVINEQNQIEDRLVQPLHARRYLGPFAYTIPKLLELASRLELTRLCLPIAGRADGSDTQLLIFTVKDFGQLEARINVGRSLFTVLFEQDRERVPRIMNWVQWNSRHTGSRRDYNTLDYSTDGTSIVPGGQKYSPRLFRAWPWAPGKTSVFGHIHKPPIKLPIAVRERRNHQNWLQPITNPSVVELASLRALQEIGAWER
jgi:hypothetical protein